MQRQTLVNSEGPTAPGRVYTFIVVSLASLVAGITMLALSAEPAKKIDTPSKLTDATTLPTSAQDHNESVSGTSVTLSRKPLPVVLAIALALGTICAVPSRTHSQAPADTAPSQDPSSVATKTGLPVLAVLFPKEPIDQQSTRNNHGWLTNLVFAGEVMLAAGICVAIYGCLTRSDVSKAFIQNPLDGYASAVSHMAGSIIGLFS